MRRECDCHAMKLYSLALWELNFIHRQIISLTKGCKKTVEMTILFIQITE